MLKKKPVSGMLAICQHGQRLDLAHIQRNSAGLPVLKKWQSESFSANSFAAQLLGVAHDKQFDGYQCVTLLNAGEYQLIQVDAPDVPESEQKEALRWRLKDLVDYPIDSVVYDAIPLPESVVPGRTPPLFAAVAQISAIKSLASDFHSARLQLTTIDLPEFAIRNVAALFEEANRGLAFLIFGEQSALLVFTYGGELFSLRRLDIGAAQLQGASVERREQLAERIVLELQRTLDGVDRQFSAITLSRMMLSIPADCGLEECFRNNLYVHFDTVDLSEVIDLTSAPELLDRETQRLAMSTIGAALRQEEA